MKCQKIVLLVALSMSTIFTPVKAQNIADSDKMLAEEFMSLQSDQAIKISNCSMHMSLNNQSGNVQVSVNNEINLATVSSVNLVDDKGTYRIVLQTRSADSTQSQDIKLSSKDRRKAETLLKHFSKKIESCRKKQ
jgi:hypothetical protein